MRTQINTTLLFAAMFFGSLANNAKAVDAPAPSAGPKAFRIGFKVSPNFAWTHILDGRMENNGMGLGFSYGMMMDFNLGNNPNYWIGTELIISSLPSKIKATDTLYNSNVAPGAYFTNTQFDYKLQYVQIPITIKLKTNEIGRLVYFGQFGVAPSVLIQNKVSVSADQNFYKTGDPQNHSPNDADNDALDFNGNGTKGAFKDNISFLRVPLVIGAGIEGKISGNTTFIAGLRFDNSFSDIFTDSKVKGRNNYLGIQLGVFF